jgi:hypothetical protein
MYEASCLIIATLLATSGFQECRVAKSWNIQGVTNAPRAAIAALTDGVCIMRRASLAPQLSSVSGSKLCRDSVEIKLLFGVSLLGQATAP